MTMSGWKPTISLIHPSPLTPMLKFQGATIFFKIWPIAKKRDSLYSTMVANVHIKFGWHQMKTVGAGFWNFQPRVEKKFNES